MQKRFRVVHHYPDGVQQGTLLSVAADFDPNVSIDPRPYRLQSPRAPNSETSKSRKDPPPPLPRLDVVGTVCSHCLLIHDFIASLNW